MQITNPKLIELCDAHIRRFENLIFRGGHGVNVPVCRYYLEIWNQGKTWAGQQSDDTVHTEESLKRDAVFRGEVIDALTDGGYDGFFSDTSMPAEVVS